jgi:hypothetical protein
MGVDSRAPTCESYFAKSLRALGFVGTRHFRGFFSSSQRRKAARRAGSNQARLRPSNFNHEVVDQAPVVPW